jgi:hypothetical protein
LERSLSPPACITGHNDQSARLPLTSML